MRKIIPFVLLVVLIILAFNPELSLAQCAMCKAAAETSVENGSTAASGINKGVLYLFITPYLIIATIGYLWWRANRNRRDDFPPEIWN